MKHISLFLVHSLVQLEDINNETLHLYITCNIRSKFHDNFSSPMTWDSKFNRIQLVEVHHLTDNSGHFYVLFNLNSKNSKSSFQVI